MPVPNKPAPGQVHITIYLPDKLRDKVKTKAAAEGESVSAVVRRALEEYIK